MKAKLLVTGSSGQLGQEIVVQLSTDYDVTPISREDADLVDPKGITEVITKAQPQYVWHVAAMTDVDACEDDANTAMQVNAKGTEYVVRACEESGCKLIYFSTDYVFDGKKETPYVETDEPNPINVYGLSKLEGERIVADSGVDNIIVRTGWMYGRYGRNFVKSILSQGKKQAASGNHGSGVTPIRVVDDQYGSPTWARDVVMQTRLLMEKKLLGVFHVTAAGRASRFEFANQIIEKLMPESELESCSTVDFPRPAARPRQSALASCRNEETGGLIGPYDQRLQDFLNEFGETLINEV